MLGGLCGKKTIGGPEMAMKTNLTRSLVMAVILLGFSCTIATGEVIYVDADASVGGNGTTWGTAYKYLQDALAVAVADDEVRVADGTYKPDANSADPNGSGKREATFQLINGVAIKGGYAGVGAGDPNGRDVELYETILSGDLDGNDTPGLDPCDLPNDPNRGENSYHVVTGNGTDANAVLDGFTITAGNANSYAYPSKYGGGMFNESSSPTVTNCTFSGNSAGNKGGGIYNYQGSPTVSNCTFSGNWANLGGGMYNELYSNPTVVNCAFIGNQAEGGGGVGNGISSPTVTNCTFSGNSAVWGGGGMLNIEPANPKVTNCTFSGNAAGRWGSGMYNYKPGSPTVTDCAFSGNSAVYGGGMNNDLSSPTITNCTFSGNSAGQNGGGMHNNQGSPTVTNCTFSGNTADANGGGMYNRSSDPNITNCILWGNTAPTGPEIYNETSSTATISYTDIEGCGGSGAGWDPNCGIDDGNNIDQDPVFVDANGLDGIPGTADDEEGYVHLRGYSPCINAGDPGGDYSGQVDVDNQPRVAYGRVDMGADEVFPIAGDVEPDGDVDFGDFAYFAEHWLFGP